MEQLLIEATPSTPLIHFDRTTGLFKMNGRSTPENPSEFYTKLTPWIETYIKEPNKDTVIEIGLEYFNTSSSKYILEMLKKLVVITSSGSTIRFIWYYEREDEDMKEAGVDFQELLKVPFEFIERESN